MSKSEGAPILKAGEVIERFGGIRPMAKKIDVAVTTVQGWKKRDVIPAARALDVLRAAATHNIDLSGLIENAPPVNQNVQPAPAQGVLQGEGRQVTESAKDVLRQTAQDPASATTGQADEKSALPRHVMTPAIWLHLGLAFLVILGLGMLLFPQKSDIQQDNPPVQEEPASESSFLGPLIPENLDEQIASLQEQAQAAGEAIGQAADKAQEISNDVLAENAGTLEQRFEKLEGHMQELAATPELQGLLDRIQTWSAQPIGQERLNGALREIGGLVGALGGSVSDEATFESALQTVRENNVDVNQTFEGIPPEDLKAATLLLAVTQFRSALNRDNTPFENDLKVLEGLMGEDSPELKASLEKLAPHAQSGVLTPAGLAGELQKITGDAVVASLQGEDVSLGDRAQARINEVFQVEKNGELITGTDTQERLNKAEQLMNAGDIEGAIAQVQSLDEEAAAVTAPWLDKAQASLLAQKAQAYITQTVQAAQNSAASASSRLIQNKETGINIMRPPSATPGHGGTIGDANPYEQ